MGNLISTSEYNKEQDIAAYALVDEPVQIRPPTKPTRLRRPVKIQRQFQNPFVDTTVYNRIIKPADASFNFLAPKFDISGRYKRVIIPKGSVVYHGGGAMKGNVELPIGIPYYSPDYPVLSPADRTVLTDQRIPEVEREKYLDNITDKNATYAYFGPLETAVRYSFGAGFMCKENCLGSFVFKKDTLALDISDDFNIYHLLYDDDSLLRADPIAHRFFGRIYGIEDASRDAIPTYWDLTIPNDPKIKNYIRHTLRNDENFEGPLEFTRGQYFILPMLIEIAKMNGCDALYNGMSDRSVLKRGSELIVGNAHAILDRNYDDPVDWQTRVDIDKILSQTNLKRIYKSMLKYKTLNVDFHAGDLYTHSIWVALYTQKRLLSAYSNKQDKWASRLVSAVFDLESPTPDKEYELLCKFAVIGAFLHDIGKMGGGDIYYDKPEHPRKGMAYLTNKAQLLLENGEKLDPQELFEELAQNRDIGMEYRSLFMIFIWGIVLFHWDFGDHIRRVNEGHSLPVVAENYIGIIWEWWVETTKINGADKYRNMFNVFIIVLMIVSVCDIQGSQLFENSNIGVNERLIIGIKGLPNAPKQHKGGKKFEQFGIDTVGFRLYETVINQLKTRKRQGESTDNLSKRNR